MLRVAVVFMLIAALLSAVDLAKAEDALFREVLTLADGRILVVEENTLEPRSMGSYNVRLYGGRDPRFPYDDFVAGILVPRDGTVESATLIETADGAPRVQVTCRSVGTGSYATHQWLRITAKGIELQVDEK